MPSSRPSTSTKRRGRHRAESSEITVVRGQVSLNPFGGIANPASGNVLTDPGGSTVNGTQLEMQPGQGDQSYPWQVSFYHCLGH